MLILCLKYDHNQLKVGRSDRWYILPMLYINNLRKECMIQNLTLRIKKSEHMWKCPLQATDSNCFPIYAVDQEEMRKFSKNGWVLLIYQYMVFWKSKSVSTVKQPPGIIQLGHCDALLKWLTWMVFNTILALGSDLWCTVGAPGSTDASLMLMLLVFRCIFFKM